MASDRRRRRRRVLRGLLWTVAALHVLEAIKLRSRRDQVRALPPAPETGAGTDGTVATGSGADVAVAVAAGADLDRATLAAVAAEMETSGADVVDLLPGDMPAHRALAYLRRMDLDRLADDPFYYPGGAAEAVALRAPVADRMGLRRGVERLERGTLLRRTVEAQRYAPAASVVRVAPDLRAAATSPQDRWAELATLTSWTRPYVSLAGPFHGIELAWMALLTAGPWLAPLPGLAALLTWCAQPALVFGDGAETDTDDTDGAETEPPALTPPDVLKASLLRLPRAWAEGLTTAVAGLRAAWAEATEQTSRPAPPVESEKDLAKLFDPRRETCPWCESSALEAMFDVPDLLQQRPGTYHLDRCHDCGHVFQNPLLTVEGLDRIYTDVYHGIGGELAEVMQTRESPSYWERADAMARFTEPARWLDVGCSYGNFFLAARRVFPKTTFDGLDMGDAADEGFRRGWMDSLHKGFFPDQADDLPSYDVVSLHHYLEHTRDPRTELAAMMKVLEPGGYLMIELPDPEAPWARRLGRYWWQWGQPQHLNFMPCDNLVTELETMGFEVLSVERGGPSFGNDLTVGLLFWAQSVSRSTLAPWLPPPTLAERVRRAAAVGAVLPALVVAQIVDRIDLAQVKKNDSVSNVYRVVAHRSDQAEPADQ